METLRFLGPDTYLNLAIAHVRARHQGIEYVHTVSAIIPGSTGFPAITNIPYSHQLSDMCPTCCTMSTATNTFARAVGQPHTFCTSLLHREDTRQVLPLGGMDWALAFNPGGCRYF